MKTWHDAGNDPGDEDRSDGTPHQRKMAELAFDAITLTAMHLRAAHEFREANLAMGRNPDDKSLHARVIAWERLSQSIYDLTAKAVKDMVGADAKFEKVVDARWAEAVKIINDTLPLITMMVEADLADVNPAYMTLAKNEVAKEDKEAGDE